MADQIHIYQFQLWSQQEFTTGASSLGAAVAQLGEWMVERDVEPANEPSPFLRPLDIRIITFP